MNRLTLLFFVLALAVPAVGAQDVQLRAFGGRTAPLAQDADIFSRSYQGGITLGVGGRVAASERVSLDIVLSYQRFDLRRPAAILENNLGVDGAGAQFQQSSPYNMLALETSMQFTLSPSTPIRPYAIGGLVNKVEFAEEIRVEGPRGTFGSRRGRTQYYSAAVQVGLGVQTRLAARVGLFAEGLINMDIRARHSYPLRTGLTVDL